MANINVQNEAKSDFDLNTLFSDSELVWEHDELDFDLGMMSDWIPSPRVSDEKETTQQRAETLALMDEPFPLNVSAGEGDGSVDMYDDEELARKQLLDEVVSESEEEDPTMEDVVSQEESAKEESAKEDSETDEEDAEEARAEERYSIGKRGRIPRDAKRRRRTRRKRCRRRYRHHQPWKWRHLPLHE